MLASSLRIDYPLARPPYIYFNHVPGTEPGPEVREPVRYVYSREGQAAVLKNGFLPIDGGTAVRNAAKVGVEIKLRDSK